MNAIAPTIVQHPFRQVFTAATLALICAANLSFAAAPLLGNGLAQHDFLNAGEAQEERMFVVRNGKIAWSCTHPGMGEISDAVMLSNGNTIINGWYNQWSGKRKPDDSPTQAIEVTPDKKVIWALSSWMNLWRQNKFILETSSDVPRKGNLHAYR